MHIKEQKSGKELFLHQPPQKARSTSPKLLTLTTLFRHIASFSHSTFTNGQVLPKSQILTALKITFLYAPAKGLQEHHTICMRSQEKSPPAMKKSAFSDLYYREPELDSGQRATVSRTHGECLNPAPSVPGQRTGEGPQPGGDRATSGGGFTDLTCGFRSGVFQDRGRVVTPTSPCTRPQLSHMFNCIDNF